MEWLWSNKEWLFSGVGVTLVTVVVLLIRRHLGATRYPVLAVATPPSPIAELDPAEVIAEAEDQTLTAYQRSMRHDRFSDKRVRWSGLVNDVYGTKDSPSVGLLFQPRCRDNSYRSNVVAGFGRNDAAPLAVVRKGDLVTVEGTIQMPVAHGVVSLEKPALLEHRKAEQGASVFPDIAPEPTVEPSLQMEEVLHALADPTRTNIQMAPVEQKYVGKRVSWTGKVVSVSQIGKAFVVLFRLPSGGLELASAEFETNEPTAFLLLSPGDTVQIEGTISIQGRRCTLERARLVGHDKPVSRQQAEEEVSPSEP